MQRTTQISRSNLGWGSAISLWLPLVASPMTLAQMTPPNPIPTLVNPAPNRTVNLSLPDVLKVVVQANQDLKNAALDRLVQQQELKAAESSFNPRFTPSVSVGITRSSTTGVTPQITTTALPSSRSTMTIRNTSLGGIGRTVELSDQNIFNSIAQVQAQLTTRIGTQVVVSGDPLSSFPFNLTITQPLLRGFGRTVNEAPVKVAQLTNTKGELTLRQTLMDKITDTILAYRTLYQRQEEVRIQESALANRRYQLEVTTALVNAGRRARADLVDIEQSLAEGENQLIEARNQLILANSELLRLMDVSDRLLIRVTPESIEALIQAAIARTPSFDSANLLNTAYRNRPDYLRAMLDIETEQLNLIRAQDNQRWGLDLQSNTSVGTSAQTSASLVLSREFGNPDLQTETTRFRVGVQKNTNRLNQLTTNIKTEVEDQLRTINATQRQIIAAQQASQLAQRQLAIAQDLFKRGVTNIFEVTQKQETLTTALNSELNAKLNFWVATVQLDRILGTTLETWNNLLPNPQNSSR